MLSVQPLSQAPLRYGDTFITVTSLWTHAELSKCEVIMRNTNEISGQVIMAKPGLSGYIKVNQPTRKRLRSKH